MIQEVKTYNQLHSPPSIDYGSLVFIAAGGSGVIYAIDEEKILKEFYDKDDEGVNVERRVFERLGGHANIVKCFGVINNGLILERGRSIRTTIKERGAYQIPLDTKIRWLQQAAEGMKHMHHNDVLHADVGCHNWITVDGRLKIIDFEGCSVDAGEARACYEWFSYKESTPAISRGTDIFAFGCAIYEILTGRQPYDELVAHADRFFRVEQLYAKSQFPEVQNMPLSKLMEGCWHGTFSSMNEILQELETVNLLRCTKLRVVPSLQ
ncbi:kinase-like domain [Venturia nashicola]|nr:kinase-like domain [Venturia nashicola]